MNVLQTLDIANISSIEEIEDSSAEYISGGGFSITSFYARLFGRGGGSRNTLFSQVVLENEVAANSTNVYGATLTNDEATTQVFTTFQFGAEGATDMRTRTFTLPAGGMEVLDFEGGLEDPDRLVIIQAPQAGFDPGDVRRRARPLILRCRNNACRNN